MSSSAIKGRKRVTLEFLAEPGSEVHVAGTFNDWDPKKKLQDKDGSGLYQGHLLLPPGRYEYKFVVNGIWCVDPNCEEWTPNTLGSLNSILRVQ